MYDIYLTGSINNDNFIPLLEMLKGKELRVYERNDSFSRQNMKTPEHLEQLFKQGEAQELYFLDRCGLIESHTLVYVVPTGRSSCVEFGMAVAYNKPVAIYFEDNNVVVEPELMYSQGHIIVGKEALIEWCKKHCKDWWTRVADRKP